jgi:epoxyqueuosine reductase
MQRAELTAAARELGLDAVGVTAASPYEETERHIRERRERGLFADMRFTMAQPEVSCHPETLLPGARSVVSAALCYWADGPEPGPGQGRLPRYTWSDAYAALREKLDALGRRLGGEYRVLVDANQHVDREAAARSGVGFYGKNTMLITRRHGSWVVLGTLVSDRELEPTPPLDAGCGSCRLCIDACPTGALDEPWTLDATRCLSYWSQAPAAIPERYREEMGAFAYGCDICQDVCPWNRGVEKRRAGSAPPSGAEPTVDLVAWLEADGDELVDRYDRLYVPRNDPRWLRRNAIVALGNTGGPEHAPALEEQAAGDDELLAEHARWALARIGERHAG